MSSSTSVEDRLAIRELCEAFGDAVMRADAEAWAETWAEEAVWVPAPGMELSGRTAIVERWKAAMGALEFCGFFGVQGPLTVTDDVARGSVYRQEFLYMKTGAKRVITGRYDDEYVKRQGRWRIARRVSHILRDETTPAPT